MSQTLEPAPSDIDDTCAVILAAGKGTRMRSRLSKVLHPLLGRPMLLWPLEAVRGAKLGAAVVVHAPGQAEVAATVQTWSNRHAFSVALAEQAEPLGTGHALQCALSALPKRCRQVLLLYGDCPRITAATITGLLHLAHQQPRAALAMLVARLDDPRGYGRILRDSSRRIAGVKEHRDCNADELAIDEVNPGFYVFSRSFLEATVPSLTPSASTGEYYLTDLVGQAAEQGGVAEQGAAIDELLGINDRCELSLAEKALQRRSNERLARSGVGFGDIDSVWVDAESVVEADARLESGVVLRGRTRVASGCVIGVGSVLSDVEIGPHTMVLPYTVASGCSLGSHATVGPFSHLRPGSKLGHGVKVGNFVEAKNATLGPGTKANHLSYIGDADIGPDSNLGAGTIFCNYNGFEKHRTSLGARTFVGSGSQLVAPLRVGDNAYIASGTTVTRDVPSEALAVGRAKQQNKPGYAVRLKARLRALAERPKT